MWEDNKGYCAVILSTGLAVALVASAVAWPAAWYWREVNALYAQHGYEQTTLPGKEGVYWVKRKDGG